MISEIPLNDFAQVRKKPLSVLFSSQKDCERMLSSLHTFQIDWNIYYQILFHPQQWGREAAIP